MNIGEATIQYLNLPTLIQPHMLEEAAVAPLSEQLVEQGHKVTHHLAAASSIIDLVHIARYQQTGVDPSAAVDRAREQTAKCTEVLAQNAATTSSLFTQLYQASTLETYLEFYRDERSLPHGGWDIRGPQQQAYGKIQEELVNPLLDSKSRAQHPQDPVNLAVQLRGLVVAQAFHRLQATYAQAEFGVFPGNTREKHSPAQSPVKFQSFDLKLVFPDQTFIPLKHLTQPQAQPPGIAHLPPINAANQVGSVYSIAQAMRKEVAGERLKAPESRSLDNLTRMVLQAVTAIIPRGENIYSPDDSRTKFAFHAKKWFHDMLADLQG